MSNASHEENSHAEVIEKKDKVTHFAVTDFRGIEEKFGIKEDDRTRHMYIIGKTGMGKSTLLENMAIQDIQSGEGLCFIDPHGTTAEKLLKYVPEHRISDVVYFAPFDTKYPVALNILEHVDEDYRHLVASGLMDSFKKVFGEDVFSGRMVYLLNNAILSLLENEGESLMGINRIFSDKDYRKKIISNVKDPAVLSFWKDEFAKYEDRYVKEATAAIQNKIGQFIMTPMIRNIVGQKKTSFDVRKIMDERKILICNFSIGQTGSENVNLIGSLLITKIYLAAMSRANLSEDSLKASAPFYFYVDEFQNFVNDSFAQILSQARKYNLGLVIAHQYIDQLTDNVKSAVFGNVGTMITFRVGANDAEVLEKEFAPQFTADDIVNLGARQIYLRLSIDGVGSKPFSARTMKPIERPPENYVPAIIAHSRIMYGKEKLLAEDEIKEWYKPIIEGSKSNEELTKDILKAAKTESIAPQKKNYSNNTNNSYTKKYSSNLGSVSTHRPKPSNTQSNYNNNQNISDQADISRDQSQVGSINNSSEYFEKRKEERKQREERSREEKNTKPNSSPPNTSLRDALEAAIAMDIRKEKDWEDVEYKKEKSLEVSEVYKESLKIKEQERLERERLEKEKKQKEDKRKREIEESRSRKIDNNSFNNSNTPDNLKNKINRSIEIDEKLKRLLDLED